MKTILIIVLLFAMNNEILSTKNEKIKQHIEYLLQKPEIDIMDAENPYVKKSYNEYLCPILESYFPNDVYKELTDSELCDIRDKYLKEIYIKEHFPNTYCEHKNITINSSSAFQYMTVYCIDKKNKKVSSILLNCILSMIIVLTMIYYYAKYQGNKIKQF